jgi:hypothetical protein
VTTEQRALFRNELCPEARDVMLVHHEMYRGREVNWPALNQHFGEDASQRYHQCVHAATTLLTYADDWEFYEAQGLRNAPLQRTVDVLGYLHLCQRILTRLYLASFRCPPLPRAVATVSQRTLSLPDASAHSSLSHMLQYSTSRPLQQQQQQQQ